MKKKSVKFVRAILVGLLFTVCLGTYSQKIDTLYYRFGKAEFMDNGTRIVVKRQFFKEKLFKLIQNIGRIGTLHQPLINSRRLNLAAWEHSVDQALSGDIGHWDFYERSNQWWFFGENVIMGYRFAMADYVLWFTSKGHRKNMFSYDYFFEGISFIKVKTYEPRFIKKSENYTNQTASSSIQNNSLAEKEQLSFYGTQVFK